MLLASHIHRLKTATKLFVQLGFHYALAFDKHAKHLWVDLANKLGIVMRTPYILSLLIFLIRKQLHLNDTVIAQARDTKGG